MNASPCLAAASEFTRQGFLRVDMILGHERWLGEEYPITRSRDPGRRPAHLLGMRLSGGFDSGAATFYDQVNPFEGRATNTRFDVLWQPTSRLNQSIGFRAWTSAAPTRVSPFTT